VYLSVVHPLFQILVFKRYQLELFLFLLDQLFLFVFI